MNVLKVNAFTSTKTGGNPAGVALDPPKDLSEDQMKYVSKELKVSETAFVYPSQVATYKLRFFSPTVEVDLCGHATIATFYTLAQKHLLSSSYVDQETNSGILPISISRTEEYIDKVMMTQQKPKFKGIHRKISHIAASLNIDPTGIDHTLPEQIVSTGLYTLPICVKSYEILQTIRPNVPLISHQCTAYGVGSYHVFTFDTLEDRSTYHARNFPPLYGITEDPVTGTANGAVASYLYANNIIDTPRLICEQGDIIGRPGRVYVEIDKNIIQVGGKAYIAEETDVPLP